MHPTANTLTILAAALVGAALHAGCRGTLPPTEPPRVTDEAVPGALTNDAAALGPLDVANGGTGVVPLPPLPGPGPGVGGAAGIGIR